MTWRSNAMFPEMFFFFLQFFTVIADPYLLKSMTCVIILAESFMSVKIVVSNLTIKAKVNHESLINQFPR